MDKIGSLFLLLLYVLIIPVFFLWLAHLLSRKTGRNMVWLAPVVVTLAAAALLFTEVTQGYSALSFSEAWLHYISSDAGMGMAVLYIPAVMISLLSAVVYNIVLKVRKTRARQ